MFQPSWAVATEFTVLEWEVYESLLLVLILETP